MPTLVHLIYIHGFQGNDTTFQSFPKHLQEHLESRIPQHLDVKIQSSLYPTYKSVKPISHATKNFLEWLTTQPPGPVILLGHSMGGLLAADAATDSSNNPDRYPGGRPKRIVGVIAFDTPYLGMHPHVVITGIASLLPKGDGSEKKEKSEEAMNEHPQVNVIDQKVTDDWEAFKKKGNINPGNAPYATSIAPRATSSQESIVSATSSNLGISPLASPVPSSSPASFPATFVDRALTFIAAKNDDPLVRWLRKHADEPFSAGKRWVTEHFQFGICMFDPPGLKARYSRLVEWETEGGMWVNYWTTTVPPAEDSHHHAVETSSDIRKSTENERLDNDQALLMNGILITPNGDPSHLTDSSKKSTSPTTNSQEDDTPEATPADDAHFGPPTKSEAKAVQKEANKQLKEEQKVVKEAEKQKKREEKQVKQEEKAQAKALQQQEKKAKKSKIERHFVVLPNGLGQVLGGMEKWENVPIAGVEDEVNAHTGLFIPKQNLDYEGLVDRVSNTVLGWCERLPKSEVKQ
ncbi:hypothetical protein GALMADRAFT_252627 [Galerina marginata CBS 339.88]|uniref:AB hydrolase-1 domain-containing protein n=1 Tax=Galerina marginata (strain CBS 339.88) TaxID=685588 RepID=A0A067SNQ0_GALM3|nr:hypothetical protein GALMADRAFT_252627 [Galerina marginata CBS 339.88]